MQFEYEITSDDYVAAQLLYWRLSTGRKRIKYAIWWTLLGVLSFVVAWGQHPLGFGTILLTISGVWWICVGTTNFFPIRHLRHTYRGLKLFGKKFQADVNEEGFEVVGDLCSWRVRWPAVLLDHF
jgi:hypothetical protein